MPRHLTSDAHEWINEISFPGIRIPGILNPRDFESPGKDVVVDFFYMWAYLEVEVGDFDSSRGLTWKFIQALVNCGSSCA